MKELKYLKKEPTKPKKNVKYISINFYDTHDIVSDIASGNLTDLKNFGLKLFKKVKENYERVKENYSHYKGYELCELKDENVKFIEESGWDHAEIVVKIKAIETDDNYNKRLKKYEEKLRKYNQWYKNNKDDIEYTIKKRKERKEKELLKKKEKIEKDLKKL